MMALEWPSLVEQVACAVRMGQYLRVNVSQQAETTTACGRPRGRDVKSNKTLVAP